jgi:hypothetical protein
VNLNSGSRTKPPAKNFPLEDEIEEKEDVIVVQDLLEGQKGAD